MTQRRRFSLIEEEAVSTERILGLAVAFVAGALLSRSRSDGTDSLAAELEEVRLALARSAMDRAARTRPERRPKIPQLPVLLDGRSVEPSDLAKYPSSPLKYVVSPDTYKDGALRVFLRPEVADEYIADVRERFQRPQFVAREVRPESEEVGRSATRIVPRRGYYGDVGGYVNLYEDINYGGSEWTFWARWGSQRDFRSVFCVLWWCSNISDRVSSVDTNISYLDGTIPHIPYTILFENINLGGQQLWLFNGMGTNGPGLYEDLGLFGWDDVASSMRYF
jgi:hypothetical protein